MSISSVTRFKRCAKCGVEYPRGSWFFASDRGKKDGLHSYCRLCNVSSERSGLALLRITAPKGYVPCNACWKIKPYTPTFFKVNGKQCRDCLNEKRRERRRQPEVNAKEREDCRKYYRANAERLKPLARERTLAWGRANPEEKRQRDRAYRDYRRTHHLDEVRRAGRVRQRLRVARQHSAEGSHTFEEIEQMYEDQGGLCAYCEVPLNGTFSIEHMVPLSRGGRDDWMNIAVSCHKCNVQKGRKTLEEFFNSI